MTNAPTPPLLKNRDFRLLFSGETISTLGDQFTVIAATWLIIKVWHDPLILGTVMAVSAIPRALFMLLGGVMTDRFSPRLVMLLSNLSRLVLVTVMAVLVLTNNVQLWMMYVLMFLFGTADAFFFPAQTAIVPHIAGKEQLTQANTMVQGVAQLSQFIGPMLAGALLAYFDRSSRQLTGIGLAFLVDAATFVFSALTLYLISQRQSFATKEESLLASVQSGLTYVWNIKALRYVLFAISAMNLLLVGPFLVGIPVIANNILPQAAQAYGAIMGAYGIGVLIGYLLAGVLPKPKAEVQGSLLMLMTLCLGVFLFFLAFATTTFAFILLSFCLSLLSGYVSLFFITIIQKGTSEQMMGRVMSILMLSSVGLLPISQAVSGAVIKVASQQIFIGAGLLFVLVVLGVWAVPEVRRIGVVLAEV